MPQIVPAPRREFKTVTMWLGIFIGSLDSLVLLLQTLTELHVVDSTTLLAINAVLGFLIVPAKLLMQNIAVTAEQKEAMVAAVAAAPLKPGEDLVTVHVNGEAVPTSPAEARAAKETQS